MSEIPRTMVFDNDWDYIEAMCDLMCGDPEPEDDEEDAMFECFHCGCRSVVWQADFDFEDFGYEGEGIVHICHCANCGADIEYRVPCGDTDEE